MTKETNGLNKPAKRLGEILQYYKIITSDQLKEVLRIQKSTKRRVGEILIDRKMVTQDQINWVLSKQLDIPYMSINLDNIDEKLSVHFSEATLRKYKILPIMELNDELVIAMTDPTDEEALKTIRGITKHQLRFVLASYKNINEIISKIFKNEKWKIN